MSLRDYWLNGPGSRPLKPITDQAEAMFESTAMREAEAAEPGFVHRNGWLLFGCPSCQEVVYDGRMISESDLDELQQLHRIACAAESQS
jgi:hypothetical protein